MELEAIYDTIKGHFEEYDKIKQITTLNITDAKKLIKKSYEQNELFKERIKAINSITVEKDVVTEYIDECDKNYKSIDLKVANIETNHNIEVSLHALLEKDYNKANTLRDEIEKMKQCGFNARKLFYLKYIKVFLYIMKIGKSSKTKVPLSKALSHIFIDFIHDIVKPFASTIKKTAVYCFECHTIQFRDRRRKERNIMRCERGIYRIPLEVPCEIVFKNYDDHYQRDDKSHHPLKAIFNLWNHLNIKPQYCADSWFRKMYRGEYRYIFPKIILPGEEAGDGDLLLEGTVSESQKSYNQDRSHKCTNEGIQHELVWKIDFDKYTQRWINFPTFDFLLKYYFLVDFDEVREKKPSIRNIPNLCREVRRYFIQSNPEKYKDYPEVSPDEESSEENDNPERATMIEAEERRKRLELEAREQQKAINWKNVTGETVNKQLESLQHPSKPLVNEEMESIQDSKKKIKRATEFVVRLGPTRQQLSVIEKKNRLSSEGKPPTPSLDTLPARLTKSIIQKQSGVGAVASKLGRMLGIPENDYGPMISKPFTKVKTNEEEPSRLEITSRELIAKLSFTPDSLVNNYFHFQNVTKYMKENAGYVKFKLPNGSTIGVDMGEEGVEVEFGQPKSNLFDEKGARKEFFSGIMAPSQPTSQQLATSKTTSIIENEQSDNPPASSREETAKSHGNQSNQKSSPQKEIPAEQGQIKATTSQRNETQDNLKDYDSLIVVPTLSGKAYYSDIKPIKIKPNNNIIPTKVKQEDSIAGVKVRPGTESVANESKSEDEMKEKKTTKKKSDIPQRDYSLRKDIERRKKK